MPVGKTDRHLKALRVHWHWTGVRLSNFENPTNHSNLWKNHLVATG